MATFQELCALLVEDTCGQLCSQIFIQLADNGRLPRQRLQQFLEVSGRQLKHALVVLIQQHIILHFTTDLNITYYQVDWRNTYGLARSHRVVCLVEDRYGEGASKIMANILQLGHAQVGDLAHALDLSSDSEQDVGNENRDTQANGDTKAKGNHEIKITTVGEFHQTLRALLRAGILVKMSQRDYMPAADLQAELEEAVISEQFPDRKVTGPKKQAELQVAVNNLKRKWRHANDYSDLRDTESGGAVRRPGMPNKRAKLNGRGLTNGSGREDDHPYDEDVAKLPNDMALRVNYAQCSAAFRTQLLEEMAEQFFGGVTAHVYGALLQVLESKVIAREDNLKVDEGLEDDDDDEEEEEELLPVATTMEVAELLDPSLDLTLGLLQSTAHKQKLLTNGESKSEKKSKGLDPEFADIGIKQEESSDEDENFPVNGFTSYHDRDKHLTLVDDHLRLLEEHPKGFCRRIGGGGRGEWRVNFPALSDTLIHKEIDGTIGARYGKVHLLFVRLLREHGRLEEKQVAAFAMMRLKDVRTVLTELLYAGLVDVQEVPREGNRQTQRTTFLWFHEQARVQTLLLQQTYQGMARTMQRLNSERMNYQGVIEKAEIMETEQTKMKQSELDDVLQWREIEEKLLVQVHRLDATVAILRDFSGTDITALVS